MKAENERNAIATASLMQPLLDSGTWGWIQRVMSPSKERLYSHAQGWSIQARRMQHCTHVCRMREAGTCREVAVVGYAATRRIRSYTMASAAV